MTVYKEKNKIFSKAQSKILVVNKDKLINK